MVRLLDYLPRGDMVDDAAWQRRHRFLLWVLVLQAPWLFVFGLALGNPLLLTACIALVPLLTAVGGWFLSGRRGPSLCVTGGLTASCAGLVILSGGAIEAHFSFFIIICFLTLYQNWVPFVWAIGFTVVSHGLGSLLVPTLMFNHHMGQHSPWTWSLIHGVAVLLACVGLMIFCRITEDEQRRRAALSRELAEGQVRQQEFTSELLLNLARRNQSMFHRQLEIINDLEERERDPDALADLFRLDHLATRVRRNAESLLVLSGEQPARVWSAPVPLRDVVRAGVAETEDLDRVTLSVEERPQVLGSVVADLTHMVAELVENAARFSPPGTPVALHSRAYHRIAGAHLLIVEDTGIGMPADKLAAANELLADPQDVDVSAAARQLGFHVVARLAERHGIQVSLTPTPGCGVTAVLVLPAALFAEAALADTPVHGVPARVPAGAVPSPRRGAADLAGHDDRTWGAPAGPPTGPFVLDGRHSWPGTDPGDADGAARDAGSDHDPGDPGGTSDDDADSGSRRRAAHAADPASAGPASAGPASADPSASGAAWFGAGPSVPAQSRSGPAASGPLPTGPTSAGAMPAAMPARGGAAEQATVPPQGAGGSAPRRALIHPIAVPPPAPPSEAATSASAPQGSSERGSGDGAGVVAAGANGLVLTRRVPQSHLAPELIRRTPGTPAMSGDGPGERAQAPQRAADPPGRAVPPSSGGPLQALSAYQASREAARSAIEGDGDAGGTATRRSPHHPTQRGVMTPPGGTS